MIVHRCRRVVSFTFVVAIACDRDEPSAPTPEPPAVAAAESHTPSPSPSPSPSAPPANEPTPPAIDTATSDFVLVAERPAANNEYVEMTLGTTSDGGVLAASGPMLLQLSADGDVEHDPSWVRGIDAKDVYLEAVESSMMWWNSVALGGTSIDDAYLVMTRGTGSRGDGSPPEVYRRNNAMWTRIPTHRGALDWFPRAFGPWKDGSLLALRGFDATYEADEDGPTEAEEHAYERAVAREKKLVVLRGTPKAPAFGARAVQAFASLPTGQIWAVMADGDERKMLHYDAATGSETTLPLPGTELWTLDVRATAPDRVWAFGEGTIDGKDAGWLARFDGTAWVQVPTACSDTITSLSIDDQGSAYFPCEVGDDTAKTTLFRWRDGEVEALKIAAKPTSVVARTPTDVWVLAAPFDEPARLFHTGTSRKEPFVIPTAMTAAEAVLEWADPQPITRRCGKAWIPIVAGNDTKAIERQLEGIGKDEWYASVVEARVRGRNEYGVVVSAVPDEKMKQATNEVVARMGKAAGTPSCNERPPLVREH